MLKKNNIIRLVIEDVTNLGFGIGRHEGQVVFVSDCITGDVIDSRIIKVNKSYAVGRVEKLIKKSELRCDTRCNNNTCKSCAYKLMDYTTELKLKEEQVRRAFLHEGFSDICVEQITPSPALIGYRNKAQYPISLGRDGEYAIGFYAPKSHRVTEARHCPLAPDIFGQILDTLATYFKKYRISVYDEEKERGVLRHVYLRRAECGGEVLLTLVINGKELPEEDELITLITSAYPDVVGILVNINNEPTNVILGAEWRTLWGRDFIYDTLGGVRLKITAPAFYQVNRAAADMLYGKARELAALKKTDTLLDLFCGAGSIGLSMASECGELIGIEIVDSAVKCAIENAAANGIKHAKFYTGDAKDTEKLLERAERDLDKRISPDVIILDPPRAGCDEKLIKFAASLSPRSIVYVSCNPTTLARDARLFSSLGYTPGTVTPFDLFPMTGHVESVVCLKRQIQQ